MPALLIRISMLPKVSTEDSMNQCNPAHCSHRRPLYGGEIGVLYLQCLQFIEMTRAGGYLGASHEQGIDQCFFYSVTLQDDDHLLL